MNFEEMKEVVSTITYKPGMDLNCLWDNASNRAYLQLWVENGVCAVTGLPAPWRSGKLYLSKHMTRQEIVGKAFSVIKSAEGHEMREWFRYRGRSIYNPHLDPDALWDIAGAADNFMEREDNASMTLEPCLTDDELTEAMTFGEMFPEVD